MAFLDDYIRVSAEIPCPMCGKPDWCALHKSGDHCYCQRVESKSLAKAGWRHDLSEPVEIQILKRAKKRRVLAQSDIDEYVAETLSHTDRWEQLINLSCNLGVSVFALSELNVGWNGRAWTFPMRNAEQKYTGVRIRYADGAKRSLTGGKEGLFYRPECVNASRVYVTEGPTDTAALVSLGLYAIGQPNARGAIDILSRFVASLSPTEVVIVADNDAAGHAGARHTYLAMQDIVRSVCVIKPRHCKDARENVQQGADAHGIIECVRGRPAPYWELMYK